jgi:tetratricopeptide (TPR) repeat protein
VLARAQEYEADGYAVDLAGRETAARMLVRMNTKARALQEEFWPAFYRQSHVDPQPPRDPFAQMLTGLGNEIDRSTAEKWLWQELKVSTGYDDTHPSLSDRLAAIGYQPETLSEGKVPDALLEVGAPEGLSAAEYYLETLPEDFIQKCDRLWKEQLTDSWREGHRVIQETRARLGELEKKSKSAPLSFEEQWERARCLAETGDSVAAVPVLQELVRQDPKHLGAHYALGAILLEQNDETGIELLQQATQLDATTTGDAYELIYKYLRNQGRQKEAETYRARSIEYFEERQELMQKALNFTYKDRFEPHELDAGQITELRNNLRKVHAVDKAYLVRKIVDGAAEPFYILGIVPTHDDPELMDQLASTITLSRPLIFVQLGQNKFLEPMLSSIPGSQIFPAE